MKCRLCLTENNFAPATGQDGKEYNLCNNCYLISALPADVIDVESEKNVYLSHENNIEHTGYVNFLNQAFQPAIKFINKDMIGLDYGAGYAAVLSQLLKLEGYKCEDYDPYFFEHTLDKKFDYIFSTETLEHFYHPNKELTKIREILKQGGYLIVMTEQWYSLEDFKTWYYTRDPSHIAFYHSKSFDFICRNFGFDKLYDDDHRVIILQKK